MGNSGSKTGTPGATVVPDPTGSVPVAPAPMMGEPLPSPSIQDWKTLRDTTLRSIIFNKRDFEVTPNKSGQMVVKGLIQKDQFDLWENTLKVMGQLSRIVYCDSGIIQEIMINPKFGTVDSNAEINQLISTLDKEYLEEKRTPSFYDNAKDRRPMISYVLSLSTGVGDKIATYVSSTSDVTFLVVPGNQLSNKITSILPTDLIICFKGSSTVENFKHDLYSQFFRADLMTQMPPGTTMSSNTTNNFVPSSFTTALLKSWHLIKHEIDTKKPTRLFITGQSLGGAYATLLGFIIAECGRVTFPFIQSIHIVSFGSPTLMGDGARNTFNAHLDSGYVTLDRVTSYGLKSNVSDVIPGIPLGFSHPGFQPLRTELYPEKKTGRAYNLDTIRTVYTGGVLGVGAEKSKYEMATKTHMSNKIVIPSKNILVQAFSHAEYFDMTYLGVFRLPKMKNPGFNKDGKSYTFYAELFPDGVKFTYLEGVNEPSAGEPTSENVNFPAPPKGGKRTGKTLRRRNRSFRRSKK